MSITLTSFSSIALEVCMIVLIVALVGGVVAWQIVKRVRAKKSGDSSCGCGCSECAARGGCPSAKAKTPAANDPDDGMPEIAVQSEVKCDFSDINVKKIKK